MIAVRRGVSHGRLVARPARGGAHERLRASDIQLLGWLAEQYGAPATQLEPLWAVGSGPSSAPSRACAAPGLYRS